ncbi:MAG: hypothetical protein NTU47_13970 [Ignavibacteriales bacterium]|nr:hypothetical protein [Ignavibacteriales bacterium]
MTNLSIEELVNKVVAEVLAELSRRGVKVDFGPPKMSALKPASPPSASVYVIDMSGFRSPVLLESHLLSLTPEVKEIAVPTGTVVTPGARDLMRKKNLILKNIPKTN